MNNKKLTYFKDSELECRCGCGLLNIDISLALMIDSARAIAKVPFIINSCCRCQEHNKKEKGSKTSSHLKGLAIDIKAIDSLTRFKIVDSLVRVGFKRILLYSTFIHADIDKDKVYPIMKIMRGK
jgi:hypothetical protein